MYYRNRNDDSLSPVEKYMKYKDMDPIESYYQQRQEWSKKILKQHLERNAKMQEKKKNEKALQELIRKEAEKEAIKAIEKAIGNLFK